MHLTNYSLNKKNDMYKFTNSSGESLNDDEAGQGKHLNRIYLNDLN